MSVRGILSDKNIDLPLSKKSSIVIDTDMREIWGLFNCFKGSNTQLKVCFKKRKTQNHTK